MIAAAIRIPKQEATVRYTIQVWIWVWLERSSNHPNGISSGDESSANRLGFGQRRTGSNNVRSKSRNSIADRV